MLTGRREICCISFMSLRDLFSAYIVTLFEGWIPAFTGTTQIKTIEDKVRSSPNESEKRHEPLPSLSAS